MTRPAPSAITVLTRSRPNPTQAALQRVFELAREAGVKVMVPADEVTKHELGEREGVLLGVEPGDDADLSLVLGGDGTILSSLRLYAGRDVPTFAVNYGAIGFLATVEGDQLEEGVQLALEGDFDVRALPTLNAGTPNGEQLAVNDISFHRMSNGRVAELGYSVEGHELGEVRCDGLVIATPAGSTGYNLANAGPVMAWGVEGYVVSFIAPHTLTARSLVVAPEDVLEVVNLSKYEPVDMITDGRHVHEVEPEGKVSVRFEPDVAMLAQLPGATFYRRLREKFGRLAY
ncbi:MAG: NAD(+)/NADH kinase [Thermoleophilaceae bacterium]